MHFEQRVTFKTQTENTLIKLDKMIKTMYPFLNRKSKLNLKNKLLIYKAFFQPVMTYAAPAWKGIAQSHYKKLQIKQNKILKMIINVHPWFNTRELHRITNMATIKEYIERIYRKYHDSCESSEIPILNQLVA